MSAHTYWSRLFWHKSYRTLPRVRMFRPRLEHLEDRTLLSASLLFDSAGNLSIFGDAADTTIRQSFTSAGFLEVAVDGQSHSSDTTSAVFDQTLAGASANTLAGIQFHAGAGHDTLTLAWDGFENRPTGNLTVSAAGADVVAQDLAVAGALTIQAQRISVGGPVRASAIAFTGSAWVAVEAGGQLGANQIQHGLGRVRQQRPNPR
jgi:hypothetical protein